MHTIEHNFDPHSWRYWCSLSVAVAVDAAADASLSSSIYTFCFSFTRSFIQTLWTLCLCLHTDCHRSIYMPGNIQYIHTSIQNIYLCHYGYCNPIEQFDRFIYALFSGFFFHLFYVIQCENGNSKMKQVSHTHILHYPIQIEFLTHKSFYKYLCRYCCFFYHFTHKFIG